VLKKLDATIRETILLDGSLYAPKEFKKQKTIIKGDEKEPAIGLASIVAKVTRDRYMLKMAGKHPLYGFENHVGYGTKKHYLAIKKHGMTDIHRKSFLKRVA
jgi:ribonuclease HII